MSTWRQEHAASEYHAALAESTADPELAARHWLNAANAELRALARLLPRQSRTVGITAVSTASLYFKAGRASTAQGLIKHWLANNVLPDFAVIELRQMLEGDEQP